MSTGTLAEKRTLTQVKTDTAPELETTLIVQPTAIKLSSDEALPVAPSLVIETPKAPLKTPKTKEEQQKKCTYCKVDRIITLSIRGSVTLVLLAICFHLIKSAK